jgi:hypothetical protein
MIRLTWEHCQRTQQKQPRCGAGYVTVRIAGTVEIRFPTTASARLVKGTEAQLQNIEVSPLGLHWPELDEDISFKGLLRG